ncbi:MAG TPA: ribosome small subunit-dependent GTPase A [Polyangiaceae bacterium]|nr:ribosome small subunit-dependent GTPase A [Polyangiaceae bacterium]
MSHVSMDECPSLLRELGLTEEWLAQVEQLAAEERGWGRWPLRVVADRGAELGLLGMNGPQRAVLSGRLRHEPGELQAPCVGDWVMVSEHAGMLRVEHVLARHGLFARKSVGGSSAVQPIAANVDLAVIVAAFAPSESDPYAAQHALNVRRIERYQLAAAQAGARALLALNKADLCQDSIERAARLADERGLQVLATSTRAELGIAELAQAIAQAGTAVLVGSSGVGKSSLTNALLGAAAQATGEVRDEDSKGRHITSHRELFMLPSGGCLIDTPGMREFAPVGDAPQDSEFASELERLGQTCKFRDCQHAGEPGCAVQQAIASGALDQDRLAHHLQLMREVASQRDRHDARARAQTKKRGKTISKAVRDFYKRR